VWAFGGANAFVTNDLAKIAMTFGAPEWLWGLLLIPLLIALFMRAEHRGLQRLQQFVSARLLPQLAGTVNRAAHHKIWFAIAWACAGNRQSGATALGLHL